MIVLPYKYESIAKRLSELIESKVYQERLPSLRVLASEFDSNVRTVMKAVEILEKERLVVLDSTRGILIADKNTPRKRTGVINIIKPLQMAYSDQDDPLIGALLREIQGNNFKVALSTLCDGMIIDEDFWRYNRSDGYIFTYSRKHPKTEKVNAIVNRLSLPAVYTSRVFPDDTPCDWFEFDNVSALREIYGNLLKAGHRQIAIVETSKDSHSFYDRMLDYVSYMKEHEIYRPEYSVVLPNEGPMRKIYGSRMAAEKLLKCNKIPTAMVLFDQAPEPLIEVFKNAGLELFKDYIVVNKSSVMLRENIIDSAIPACYSCYQDLATKAFAHLQGIISGNQTKHFGEYVKVDTQFITPKRLTLTK